MNLHVLLRISRLHAHHPGKKANCHHGREREYYHTTPKSRPCQHVTAARQPWASETKDEAVQRDAKGPQLLANLSRLRVGAVRVDYHMQTARTVSFD
ncbi:hypothetical protein BJV78DRAFT_1179613 [Lactifluus subvellereus]|nr:hypothetical protein BJV78DRAFT_1179613 [Lactifluus subvellereus]